MTGLKLKSIKAETNIKFKVWIIWMVKWVNNLNTLNQQIYHKNAWFMLETYKMWLDSRKVGFHTHDSKTYFHHQVIVGHIK